MDERGGLRLKQPFIYQESDGVRAEVSGRCILASERQIGFELDEYDASLPLVIDPVLKYSVRLGGSSSEEGRGIAVDSFGNAYVTGSTYSPNFPAANAYQASIGGFDDAFVSKLNFLGNALAYSTYLGGSGTDNGWGIAVDSSGNAYVTG